MSITSESTANISTESVVNLSSESTLGVGRALLQGVGQALLLDISRLSLPILLARRERLLRLREFIDAEFTVLDAELARREAEEFPAEESATRHVRG